MYVVTEFWCNGESYEDYSADEKPVAIFEDLDMLKDFIKNNNFTELEKVEHGATEYKFSRIEEPVEEFKCPFGTDFWVCEYQSWGGKNNYYEWIEHDCEGKKPDIYTECEMYNDSQYDFSYIEYYVYRIENINGGF